MNREEYKEYIQRQLFEIDIKLSKKLTLKELGVCLGVLIEMQKFQKDVEIQKRIDQIKDRLAVKQSDVNVGI